MVTYLLFAVELGFAFFAAEGNGFTVFRAGDAWVSRLAADRALVSGHGSRREGEGDDGEQSFHELSLV